MSRLCFLFVFFCAIASAVSICDSYSASMSLADQNALINAVVTGVFTEITTALPNPDIRYFNGEYPFFIPKSTNFTAGGAPLTKLVQGLVSFFGSPNQGLGCSSFPSTNFNLQAIHANIFVNREAQDYFVVTVVNTMQRLGVATQDLTSAQAFLESTTPAIVPITTCSQFSSFISPSSGQPFFNESDFMLQSIQTFAGLVTQDNTFTKRFFDGRQPAGSTALTAGGPPLEDHLFKVHAYFGGPGFMSCLGADFPLYTGSIDNTAIHQNMGISPTVFDQWVKKHIEAFTVTTRLTATQLDSYKATLNSFKPVVVTAPDTICNKYAFALGISTNQLVFTVVDLTFNSLIFNTDTNPFFTGKQPQGSTDFETNTAAKSSLYEGLISFFGGALGCADDTISAYNNSRSLNQIHINMGVTDLVFDIFNFLLVGNMKELGVSEDDGNTVLALLNGLRNEIVQRDTICNRYSKALQISNQALVKTVVDKTVQGVVTDPITLPYFNGVQPRGSIDFTTDSAKTALLSDHLVQFFGGALGCGDGTITPFTGGDLGDIHRKMIVSAAAFDTFNNILLNVLRDAGVTEPDVGNVSVILESTRKAIVPAYTIDDFRPNYLPGGIVAAIVICTIILALVFVAVIVGLVMIENKLPKFH